MAYAYIDTVGPDGRLSGYGSYRGFGAFGGAEGDALGTGCLCGGSGVCTTAKLQGPAMATLRAAMRAAGLPTSSGNWTTGEQNTMNNLARANGQAASSKFLVDGGPCVALKSLLSAPPAPVVVGPPATPITDCASLLANAPPVPPGTPVATVVAVLQSIAGPGFDVNKCMGGAAPPVPTPTPQDVLPPVGGQVTTPSQSMLPYVLGGVGLLALGGIAFVAMRRSSGGSGMRKNGRRKNGRGTAIGGWDPSTVAGWRAKGARVGEKAASQVSTTAEAMALAEELGRVQARLSRMTQAEERAFVAACYRASVKGL